MSMGKEIKFKLTDEYREQLNEEAKKRGISPDECASQLVKEWLQDALSEFSPPRTDE